MENNVMESKKTEATTFITSQALLDHWLGHRRVTRKVIEAFPEDKLFNYSIGGMRTFADLVKEILTMAGPGIRGIVEGTWPTFMEAQQEYKNANTRDELLKFWDKATEQINTYWPQIPSHRFQEIDSMFGQYEGPIYWSILYFVDNEIHHRGQGYVYLRALEIAPPPFWDRG